MKKLFLALSAFSATFAFAETINVNTLISGTVSKTEAVTVGSNAVLTDTGVLEFNIATLPQYSLIFSTASALVLKDGGTIDMNSGGIATGGIQFNSTASMDIQSSAGNIYVDKIALYKGTLTVSKENAIIKCSSGITATYLTLPYSNVKININATNSFVMDLRASVSATFDINNGAVLNILNWEVQSGKTSSMLLSDYISDSIFLSTATSCSYTLVDNVLTVKKGSIWQNINLLDGSGSALDGLSLNAVANGYTLSIVPEPAQWAAILGAAALAFTAYRRRR